MTEIMVTSSVLILLLAVLRQILRKRIDPRVQYALWLLVAARLLIPGTLFTAPVSVMGAAEDIQTVIHQAVPGPYTPDSPVSTPEAPSSTSNTLISSSEAAPLVPSAAVSVNKGTHSLPEFDMREIQTHSWSELVWKTGIAIVGGAMVLSNLAFYFRLRKNRKYMDLPDTPWTRELDVYVSKNLPSPCLFGTFQPAIYLNRAALNAEHPEHILAHEYAHYRHGDHFWSILRCVCVAVHWYNPLVWWAAALSRQDCELACDASALRQLGEEEAIDYGHTLLSMISRSRNPAGLLRTATTMTAGKRTMKQRISLIIHRPKMRKFTLVLVALLTVFLAACAFGHAMEAGTDPSPGDTPAGDVPVSVMVGQGASSRLEDSSLITDPDEVARLWELYRSFEYEGTYDPTGKGGWPIIVIFRFGAEPNEDTDIHFILSQDGIFIHDENLLLKNIDEIYAEFLRMSTSNPVQHLTTVSAEDALANNAQSIVEMVRQGEDVSEWLPLMNYMDWNLLAQAAVEAGMDDGEAVIDSIISELYSYIYQQGPSMTMAEHLYILSTADDRNGALPEGYDQVVYALFTTGHSKFANVVLEMLPEAQQNTVLDIFCEQWYYHMDYDHPDMPTHEEAIAYLETTRTSRVYAAPTEMVLYSAGSTFQFQVFEVSGIYALTYESSDPAVADVDTNGIVTATGPGEAVITAHLESASVVRNFTCAVSCNWRPVLPGPDPEPQDVMMENARSIVAQVQTGADVSEWLPLLNYMDWSVMARAAVEAGADDGDGSGAVVNIIEMLRQYIDTHGASMAMAQYLYILSATDGLDGAPAESYSFLVYRMHAVNPSRFAYVVLEMLPEAQQGVVLDFFRYEYSAEMAYYNDYDTRRNGKGRPSREEAVHVLEADLTESLSQQITEFTFHGPQESAQHRFINVQGVGTGSYTSENPEIATVNDIGLIVAVAPGETVIHAHYEGAGGPLDVDCTVHCDW